MADLYLQFSEVIPNLTADEETWLRSHVSQYLDDTGIEYSFDDDKDAKWGRYLWIYSDEHGDPDTIGKLVQRFLWTFRPNACWCLTYSETCSKPRVGLFGGGGIFVTAKKIKGFDAHMAVERQAEKFEIECRSNQLAALVELAENRGIDPEDLDDAVSDSMGARASAINNEGLPGQLSFLLDELGFESLKAEVLEIVAEKATKSTEQGS